MIFLEIMQKCTDKSLLCIFAHTDKAVTPYFLAYHLGTAHASVT